MAKNKMWNGIGWYGFIGPTTSTTHISLFVIVLKLSIEVGSAPPIFAANRSGIDNVNNNFKIIY